MHGVNVFDRKRELPIRELGFRVMFEFPSELNHAPEMKRRARLNAAFWRHTGLETASVMTRDGMVEPGSARERTQPEVVQHIPTNWVGVFTPLIPSESPLTFP